MRAGLSLKGALMLGGIDYGIIILYFLIVLGIGVYFTKRAGSGMGEYFLAGRAIPWYILGVSGVATFIDMSGTMLQTSFFYMLGVKGYWVAWRGAVALFLAFLMIFMGKWLQRSGVMTNAEWVEFRFGAGAQGKTARVLNALATLVFSIAITSYFFIGSGKFLSRYLPFTPEVSALLLFLVMLVYTVASGFYGVVYTDLFQALLILFAIGYITVKAMAIGTPEYFAAFTTPDWHTLAPPWRIAMPPGYENMRVFGLLVLFWIFSNLLQGFAVPLDSWTSQRYYAAKDERESSLVAWLWITLFSLRFPLMMGVAVLAVGIAGNIADPETAFPAVFDRYLPLGVKGLMLAALIAAQMSSICTIVNSPAAYFVNDIYHAYLRPRAGERHLVRASYLTTIAIVLVGVGIGWMLPNINSIWAWIMMGLVTGVIPANILKWFWWRFNGAGYAAGMAGGLLGALASQLAFPGAPEYTTFTFVVTVSVVSCIVGTFFGKPADIGVLVNFYRRTRPFGFWEPVRKACDPGYVADVRRENRHDLLLLGPAALWQAALFWMMTCFVVKKWDSFTVTAAVVATLSYFLYRSWYRPMSSKSSVEPGKTAG
jgi:Na+/proline symporter